jgi:hypothetical protein
MKLAILMLSGSLLAGSALAQQPKQSRPRNAKPKVTAVFSTAPFNSSVERLSPNYLGHSMIKVWAELYRRRLQFNKREYETSDAWASRVQKLKGQPLISSTTMLSQFAFQAYDVDAFYDADTKIISVTVSPGGAFHDEMNGVLSLSGNSMLGWKNTAQSGSFVGSNAFGVKRRVRAETEQFYFMAFQDTRIGLADTFNIENVGGEQAKLIKPQIRVLVIGTLQEPYAGLSASQNKATLDDPVQTTSYEFYLYFKPEAIWFYNLKSGEVYHKALLLTDKK